MLLPLAILASLAFQGNFTQGGLVKITAPEKTQILLDGENVDGFKNGSNYIYYVGFGRDAKPQSALNVTYSNGKKELYPLNILQREYEVQKISHLDEDLVSPSKDNQKRIEKEALDIGIARVSGEFPCPGELKLQRPSTGLVTGWFGSQRVYNGKPKAPHSGVDFKGDIGAPVYAPEGGRIVFYKQLFLTGNTMVIDHGCGIVSTFLHLDGTDKKVGDTVKKGETVARIGKTGLATGPHLHWNLNWGSVRLDPLLVVQ